MSSKIKNKKVKIAVVAAIAAFLTFLLAFSGVGIYFALKKEDPTLPEVVVNPIDFSMDKWDGKSVSRAEYIPSYAGRSSNTITIDSAQSFAYFINQANDGETFEGKTVYLNCSVDMAGYTIDSIKNFKGTFDGGFYNILNANINGIGLFEKTENAVIKNIGLYNCTLNKSGLIGEATNTTVSNVFVRSGEIKGEETAGLIFEVKGFAEITDSFVDANEITYGLIGDVEQEATINTCYYTHSNRASKSEKVNLNKVIKNPKYSEDFITWRYAIPYIPGVEWCNYKHAENSQELEFKLPVQSGFVKVYLQGSYYEAVTKIGDSAVSVTSISEATSIANGNTEIRLIVEKVYAEEEAQVPAYSTVSITSEENTSIIRGDKNRNSIISATAAGSKLVLADNLVLDGNKEYVEENNLKSGAVITSYADNLQLLGNLTIQNNVNNQTAGGAILIYGNSSNAKVNLGNLVITNCSSSKDGGAICVIDAALNLENGIISKISGDGAAVSVTTSKDQPETVNALANLYGINSLTKTEISGPIESSDHVALDGFTFIDIEGEAIIAHDYSNIIINACNFINVGGIYTEGSVIATNCNFIDAGDIGGSDSDAFTSCTFKNSSVGSTYSDFELTNCELISCEVAVLVNSYFTNSTFDACSIYDPSVGNGYEEIEISSCNIINAKGDGLRLVQNPYLKEISITITDTTISGSENSAIEIGSEYSSADVTLNITNSTISNSGNSAIYAYGIKGDVTITNSEITGTTSAKGINLYLTEGSLKIDNSRITKNNIGLLFSYDESGDIEILNSTISDNVGGVYALSDHSGSLTIKNCIISNNKATNGSGYGVNCDITDGGLTIENSVVSGNDNGIVAEYLIVCEIKNCQILNNTGIGVSSTEIYIGHEVSDSIITGNGQGIYFITGDNDYDSLTITNSTISNNSAAKTQGVGVYCEGDLTITNSHIDDNKCTQITSTSETGVGIYVKGNVEITDSTVNGNTNKPANSTGHRFGGGMYIEGTITATNTEFNNNYISGHGGAIYVTSTVKLTNCSLNNNFAGAFGGAVFAKNASSTGHIIDTCNISGNKATRYASALNFPGTSYIYDSVVANNVTENIKGVGGDNNPATIVGSTIVSGSTTVVNSMFVNNTSPTNVGGVLFTTGATRVISSTFDGNSAVWQGGAIRSTSNVTLFDSTFANNTIITPDLVSGSSISFAGGAAVFTTQQVSIPTEITYTDLRLEEDQEITLSNKTTSFISNSNDVWEMNGLAIYAGKTIVANNTIFRSNKAVDAWENISTEAHNVYSEGNVTLNDCTFDSNKAGCAGVTSNGKVTANNCSFTNQEAYAGYTSISAELDVLIEDCNFANSYGNTDTVEIWSYASITVKSSSFNSSLLDNYCLKASGSIEISDSSFKDFVMNEYSGGGFLTCNELNVSNSSFENIKCAHLINAGTTTFVDSSIINCGISYSDEYELRRDIDFIQIGDLTLTNVIISNNETPTYSNTANGEKTESWGGVTYYYEYSFIDATSVTITNSELKNNKADDKFINCTGAVSITDSNIDGNQAMVNVLNGNSITAENTSLSSNKSTLNYVMLASNNAEFDNVVVNDNESTESGILRASNITAESSQFTNNTGYKNNFYSGVSTSIIRLTDCLVKNNSSTAESAGFRTTNWAYLTNVDFISNETQSYNTCLMAANAEITGCNFTNNNSVGGSGAVYITKSAKVESSTFSQNKAKGPTLYCGTNTQSLEIKSCSFINNEVTGSGGGFSFGGENGTVKVTDSLFHKNTATTNGGAIHSSSALEIHSSTFSNNKSSNIGGAIYTAKTISIQHTPNGDYVEGSTVFINNTAKQGGALYCLEDISGDDYDSGKIANTVFTKNSTTENSGGAIYINGVDNTEQEKYGIIFKNVTFSENTSASSGGAISSESVVTVSDSLFSYNSALVNGGAVYVSGDFNIENITATYNQSTKNGGFAYVSGKTNIENVEISNNTAQLNGGAIYSAGEVTIDLATFANNYSANTSGSTGGGAIYATAKVTIGSAETKNVSSFINNGAYRQGGAIRTNGSSSPVVAYNAVFNKNYTNTHYGGAVYGAGGATVDNCIFTENVASSDSETVGNGNGAGVYCPTTFTGQITLTNSTFTNNWASGKSGSGAAVCVYGQVLIDNCEFVGNKAPARSAGTIYTGYTEGTAVIIKNSLIYDSYSGDHGGAIRGYGMTLENVVIANCEAKSYGGAINSSGDVVIKDSYLYNNKAGYAGGAISVWGNLTVENTTIADNTATGNVTMTYSIDLPDGSSTTADYRFLGGGAIAVIYDPESAANNVRTNTELNLTDCEIYGNTSYTGAAIWNDYDGDNKTYNDTKTSKTTIKNCFIHSNTNTNTEVFADVSDVDENCTVVVSNALIANSTITGRIATETEDEDGYPIYSYTSSNGAALFAYSLEMYNTEVSYHDGVGVNCMIGSKISDSKILFCGNGILFNYDAGIGLGNNLDIINTKIAYNKSTAIYSYAATEPEGSINIIGCEISYNSCLEDQIYWYAAISLEIATLTVKDSLIHNNSGTPILNTYGDITVENCNIFNNVGKKHYEYDESNIVASAIYAYNDVTINNTKIYENSFSKSATGSFAAVVSDYGKVTINNSLITGKTLVTEGETTSYTTTLGRGVYTMAGDVICNNTEISYFADYGIYASIHSITLDNSKILYNGNGVYSEQSVLKATNTQFEYNGSAGYSGRFTELVNCKIYNNESGFTFDPEMTEIGATITNCEFRNNKSYAIYSSGVGNVDITNSEISNNGGNGINTNGTNVTLTLCKIENNKGNGVHLASSGSIINVYGCSISSNGGAGIYQKDEIYNITATITSYTETDEETGVETITKTHISYNLSAGIRLYSATAKISNAIIEWNACGVYGDDIVCTIDNVIIRNNLNEGIKIQTMGYLTLSNSEISNNGAEGILAEIGIITLSISNSIINYNSSYGCYINRFDAFTEDIFTITGSTFNYNGEAGLYLGYYAKASISTSYFNYNDGYGVHLYNTGDVSLEYVACSYNKESGLYTSPYIDEFSDVEKTSTTYTIGNCNFIGNAGSGANIEYGYLVVSDSNILDNNNNGIRIFNRTVDYSKDFSLTNVTISRNKWSGIIITTGNINLKLNNCKISNNIEGLMFDGSSVNLELTKTNIYSNNGSGILCCASVIGLTINAGKIYSNETSNDYGGGIYIDSDSTIKYFKLSNLGIIYKNTANGNDNDIYLYNTEKIIEFTDDTIIPVTKDYKTSIYFENLTIGDTIATATTEGNASTVAAGLTIENGFKTIADTTNIKLTALANPITINANGGKIKYTTGINTSEELEVITGYTSVGNGRIYTDSTLITSITGFMFERTGYNAKGIYNASEDGAQVIGLDVATFTVPWDGTCSTYYVQWEAIEYKITYDLDGGMLTQNNISTFTIESETISLNSPIKDGCTFVKWQDQHGNTVTAIEQGSYGDLELKAIWEPAKYTVTFKNGDTVITEDNEVIHGTSPIYNETAPEKASAIFLGWIYKNEIITDLSNIKVTENIEFVAKFHDVVISSSNEEHGIVSANSISKPLTNSSSVITNLNTVTIDGETITAEAKTGYLFKEWKVATNHLNYTTQITAMFASSATITIITNGAKPTNDYGVIVEQGGKELARYNSTFTLIKGENYNLSIFTSLVSNAATNEYQTFKYTVNGTTYGPYNSASSSMINFKNILQGSINSDIVIELTYSDVYLMQVNYTTSNVMIGIEEVKVGEELIPYVGVMRGYLIPVGSEITFKFNKALKEGVTGEYYFTKLTYTTNDGSFSQGYKELGKPVQFISENKDIYSYKTSEKIKELVITILEATEPIEIPTKEWEDFEVETGLSSLTLTSTEGHITNISKEDKNVKLYASRWNITFDGGVETTLEALQAFLSEYGTVGKDVNGFYLIVD